MSTSLVKNHQVSNSFFVKFFKFIWKFYQNLFHLIHSTKLISAFLLLLLLQRTNTRYLESLIQLSYSNVCKAYLVFLLLLMLQQTVTRYHESLIQLSYSNVCKAYLVFSITAAVTTNRHTISRKLNSAFLSKCIIYLLELMYELITKAEISFYCCMSYLNEFIWTNPNPC